MQATPSQKSVIVAESKEVQVYKKENFVVRSMKSTIKFGVSCVGSVTPQFIIDMFLPNTLIGFKYINEDSVIDIKEKNFVALFVNLKTFHISRRNDQPIGEPITWNEYLSILRKNNIIGKGFFGELVAELLLCGHYFKKPYFDCERCWYYKFAKVVNCDGVAYQML